MGTSKFFDLIFRLPMLASRFFACGYRLVPKIWGNAEQRR